MLLQNKVSLITGSNKGIGLSIVKTFLEEGSIVYASVRKLSELSNELENLSSAFNQNLSIIELDVTNVQSCRDAFTIIKKECNRLDILVNNAGKISYELFPLLDINSFEEMLQVNTVGLVRVTQYASRFMTKQKQGSIINLSSVVSVKGVSGQASYSASKGAVNSLTLSLAKEFSSYNVRVNAVAPGMVATDRLVSVSSDKFADQKEKIGFGRMANPEEIANICLFLASDQSSYITGQIITADGSFII